MNNAKIFEKLKDNNVIIDRLYWIAGESENGELKELLESLDKEDWEKMFPEIYNSKHFKGYREEENYVEALYDFNKFGFVAKINIPVCYEFSLKNKKPTSWASNEGHCHIGYVYSETLSGLISGIIKESKSFFKYDLEQHLKKVAV